MYLKFLLCFRYYIAVSFTSNIEVLIIIICPHLKYWEFRKQKQNNKDDTYIQQSEAIHSRLSIQRSRVIVPNIDCYLMQLSELMLITSYQNNQNF